MSQTQQYETPVHSKRAIGSSGFALVVTLSLMILLTIVAVGLLTLSSVSLRSASQEKAMAMARTNARLGLMLAIGEIQKELGPDQKISAVSDILAPTGAAASPLKHSHLTGVWKSRLETANVINASPDYDQKKNFLRWLVSSAKPDDLLDSDFAASGSLDNPVMMVGTKGAGSQATYAGKVPVSNSNLELKGNYAWWVADENCKGFINPVDTLTKGTTVPSVPDSLAASGTPGAYGMQALIANYPANTPASANVITHGQLGLADPAANSSQKWFHDLSPYASGLMTNVTLGGWRQDLSLYLETAPGPTEAWPGTPAPGPNRKYALSEVNDYDVLAWKYLYNYYHIKENIQMVGGRPTLRSWNGQKGAGQNDKTNPRWNAGVIRPAPVLVRAVIFISFGSVPSPTNPSQLVVRFYAQPVLTLWNPYNVDLKIEGNQLNYLFTSLPMGQKISVNGQLKETFTWRGTTSTNTGANDYSGAGLQPIFPAAITLQPGEARMFSPESNSKATIGIHQHHYMYDRPFRYTQGFPGGMWGGGSAGGKVDDQEIRLATGGPTDRIQIETYVAKWDQDGGAFHRRYPTTFDIRAEHSDGSDGDYQIYQWAEKMGWQHLTTTPAIASPDKLTKTNKPSATFGDVLNAPKPFMVIDVQLKALDEKDLPNKTWRDCIPSHPYMGVIDKASDLTPYLAGAYKLRFDSINSYEQAYEYLQVAKDKIHTFFGGSHFPDAGQSWITDREIPMAPFTSLAQLQHLPQHSVDTLYSSGYYFQNRAIGNSFASPGVPADKIKAAGWPFNVDVYMNSSGGTISGAKFAGDQFHTRSNIDRSYAANQLLWDDYFFSSMAAKNDLLRSASSRLPLDRVVKDFLEAGKPLPNQRFRPYLAEKNASAVLKALLRGAAPTTTAFRETAAYLTADGAFNINSVSVPAWKAMLAAAHQRDMVLFQGTGAPKIAGKRKYVVSRFSMPNEDVTSATSAGVSTKWQGYRELDEDQLTELAEAIVRQVKQRGPFRSLAEFVNRRLAPESDERSRYGALQAALEDPAVSINSAFRQPEVTASHLNGSRYQNKTAALGSVFQGSPATVTQADLLNTIGPIITARSDTFTVRAYGEARDSNGKVLATAWCEGVVQRVPTYVDPTDAAAAAPTALRSQANKKFGRRFNLITFRWLSDKEL